MIRATFVMEQHIGHRTFYENLRRTIDPHPAIQAAWIEVTYERPFPFWSRLPLPEHIKGSVNGRLQTRAGLHAHHADIAIFNTQVPAALAGGLIRQQPYMLCTDITPKQYDEMAAHYNHQPDKPGLLSAYKHATNRRLFQDAIRVLPWSNWTADSLIHDYGVNPNQIAVIPPGIDLNLWEPIFHKADGPMQILFVGGDFHRKGGQTLLNAFRMLPRETAVLHIVTRTPIAEEEGVHVYNNMQPNSRELIQLYQQAHVFVLPTQAEAFGIAAIEASAMGLPVIGTAVGGLIDVIANGETGYLVPPNCAESLAARLEEMASYPQQRFAFGRAARRRVEQHFNACINANRIIDIIHNVLHQSVPAQPNVILSTHS